MGILPGHAPLLGLLGHGTLTYVVAGRKRYFAVHAGFLEVLDELNRLNIGLISFRENIDTGGPLGRAMIVIVAAISELERSLIVERVKSGMRRARLEGRQIGRARLDINREQVVVDRRTGMSLTQAATRHNISRASVCRLMKEFNGNSQAAVLASGADFVTQVLL